MKDPVNIVLALADRVQEVVDEAAATKAKLEQVEAAYRNLRHWVLEAHVGSSIYVDSGQVELAEDRRYL